MFELDFNKSFAILGLGISGVATLDFLRERGVEQILLSDSNAHDKLSAAALQSIDANKEHVKCEFGIPHSETCLEYDYLIISPGIAPEAEILRKAREKNISILTELDLASEYLRTHKVSAGAYVGITGTNGKSTTTAWTAHILGVPACGNIGLPFVQAVSELPISKWYVCEMSSFQLQHSKIIKPSIAAITNITPDHINWHGSWENYVKAKFKITQQQQVNDWLIIPPVEPMLSIETEANLFFVEASPKAVSLHNNAIWINSSNQVQLRREGQDHMLCRTDELPLPGKHNLENAMFAAAIAFLTGLSIEQVRSRLLSFRGLEHRLEFVCELDGKRFYNDSKATNPESSVVALKAFDEGIIWLAGGRDKQTDLAELLETVKQRVSSVILYGEAAERFHQELLKGGYMKPIHRVDTLKQAFERSLEEEGQVVLLSPACASFDQFSNFEERGKVFKQLVGLKCE